MEKNDISDTEQDESAVNEVISVIKPKRKLNLTDEQRAVRAERMRKVAFDRIQKSRAVNAEVSEKVKEIHKAAVQKGKKIRMKKAIEIQHPPSDSDSDSDSSVELKKSKGKKGKSNQPIIIIKNYGMRDNKQKEEVQPKLQEEIFKTPEPIIQQHQVRLGYFV
jgi:hypothetical protein